VVGDGGTTICQSRSGSAVVINLRREDSEDWRVSADMLPNGPYGSGTLTTLNLATDNSNHYIPVEIDCLTVSTEELSEFLDLETAPVFNSDQLVWSDELNL